MQALGDAPQTSAGKAAVLTRRQVPGHSGRSGAVILTKPRWQATDRAMLGTLLHVALGGAIGASLRYGAGLLVLRLTGPGFPMSIITVNILGSFIMGAFFIYSSQRGLDHLNPLIMTGMLGGFTTFSSFSLETFTLVERGDLSTALLYVGLSVILSISALFLGVWLARYVWA